MPLLRLPYICYLVVKHVHVVGDVPGGLLPVWALIFSQITSWYEYL